jgi:aspartyl protease family protein
VTLFRLAVFAGIVVVLAVLAPKVVPDLIAGIAESPESETMPEPAAEPESPQAPPPLDEPAPKKREILRQVALAADSRGHFVAAARINGQKVVVLVDTGATSVAISADTAQRLGIYLTKSDFTGRVRTANGVVAVAPVKLREVTLGNVTVRNVEAAVSPGDTLGVNLLGMSFLGRLSKFEVNDGELVLTQ